MDNLKLLLRSVRLLQEGGVDQAMELLAQSDQSFSLIDYKSKKFLSVNSLASKVFGFSDAELQGVNVWDITSPDYHANQSRVWKMLDETGAAENIKKVNRQKDDSFYALVVSSLLIHGPENKYVLSTMNRLSDKSLMIESVSENVERSIQSSNIFPVEGDSMSPTLLPGDLVFINYKAADSFQDNIYMINLYGAIDIKRLVFGVSLESGDKGVLIKTDNTMYDDFTLSYSEVEQHMYILGSVEKVFRAMKPSEAANNGLLQSMPSSTLLM